MKRKVFAMIALLEAAVMAFSLLYLMPARQRFGRTYTFVNVSNGKLIGSPVGWRVDILVIERLPDGQSRVRYVAQKKEILEYRKNYPKTTMPHKLIAQLLGRGDWYYWEELTLDISDAEAKALDDSQRCGKLAYSLCKLADEYDGREITIEEILGTKAPQPPASSKRVPNSNDF